MNRHGDPQIMDIGAPVEDIVYDKKYCLCLVVSV